MLVCFIFQSKEIVHQFTGLHLRNKNQQSVVAAVQTIVQSMNKNDILSSLTVVQIYSIIKIEAIFY